MKKLFAKEIFENDIALEVKHRSSSNNGVSVKPKELKGIKQSASVKCRRKTFQLFIDKEKNLYYKDSMVIVKEETMIIDNEVKNTLSVDKVWFKITGLYERKDQFILDTLRELCDVSERMYTENKLIDNIELEDIYNSILTSYYKIIKENNI